MSSCGQFHLCFLRAFFVQIYCQSQNVPRKSCRNNVRTKNSYIKTLMKLTPSRVQERRPCVPLISRQSKTWPWTSEEGWTWNSWILISIRRSIEKIDYCHCSLIWKWQVYRISSYENTVFEYKEKYKECFDRNVLMSSNESFCFKFIEIWMGQRSLSLSQIWGLMS